MEKPQDRARCDFFLAHGKKRPDPRYRRLATQAALQEEERGDHPAERKPPESFSARLQFAHEHAELASAVTAARRGWDRNSAQQV